jgi:predicted Rossmann fold flavoprotein
MNTRDAMDVSVGETNRSDVVVIGAGAAGIMAAIWAARAPGHGSVVLLDGARRIGAKILIAGGGRCNVTHETVDASSYAGSSRHAIGKILRRFDVPATVEFFRDIGVELKREDTGKLFPTTDRARTVLDALLIAVRDAGVTLRHPRRVERVEANDGGFLVSGEWGTLSARRVVIATGGQSVPKSGSDGHGYEIARFLGHTVRRLFPGLVPLTLPRDHFVTTLSGLSSPAALEVRSSTGKRLAALTGDVLCTHFGLSGPAVLDISRYYIDAALDDARVELVINWLPGHTAASLEREWLDMGSATVGAYLKRALPDRLAVALCAVAGVDGGTAGHALRRGQRKSLAETVARQKLPITGHRGYNHAEVTAGGVPLDEIRLETMESRVCPGLYLCGEICDVDGRIGGYNFQWAWSSGYTAGISAGRPS